MGDERVIQPRQVEEATIEANETYAQYLERLEKTGRYLFHGSPAKNILKLEPRAATDVSGDPWRNDTAVFATPTAALAVQRAILPDRSTIQGEWKVSSGTNPQNPAEPLLVVSSNILLGDGTVYVLDKRGFTSNETGSQWKSNEPVRPLTEITVDPEVYEQLGGKTKIIE